MSYRVRNLPDGTSSAVNTDALLVDDLSNVGTGVTSLQCPLWKAVSVGMSVPASTTGAGIDLLWKGQDGVDSNPGGDLRVCPGGNGLQTPGVFAILAGGGVAGTDEIQLYHDLTDAFLTIADAGKFTIQSSVLRYTADGSTVRLDVSATAVGIGSEQQLIFTSTANASASGSVGITYVDANTVRVSDGSSGYGHLVTAGDKHVHSNVNNSTTTFANISDLTFPVVSGRTYRFRFSLHSKDSVAGEGCKWDLGGGSATASVILAQYVLFNNNTVASMNRVGSLTTAVTAATVTGDTLMTIEGIITASSTGTFIPRFAQNSHSSGTATISAGSWGDVKDSI